VPASYDRTPLLGSSHQLNGDLCVRLRMARSSDIVLIRDLLDRRRGAGDVDLTSLVQFDPRRRCVICATALIDSAETLVGVGSISIDGHRDSRPDALLVADEHADEITQLLVEALRIRAAQASDARAA
jgi:hypothetical protein